MNVTNHPIVESYWIEELPNGVIHLLINVKERGIYCHQFNDNEYLILEDYSEDYTKDDILTIPDFLDKTKAFMYISSSYIEKDQINYYFIPHQREWVKNRKFIIE